MNNNITKNNPIGVFDSGLGGLTIYKEIRKELPNEDIIYMADNEKVPYGDLSSEEILGRCRRSAQWFLERGSN